MSGSLLEKDIAQLESTDPRVPSETYERPHPTRNATLPTCGNEVGQ